MPIEIKELHIKATVVDKKANGTPTKEMSAADQERMKKEILKACVAEVMQILEDK
ncbi:MAG TPA: DUF5908 family protein, partial [Cyclobacteriaceae bacterium]|nr:DUF5908 family protein [Cyclobacteriaceae bacterium]